jgi:hypothetical protein
LAFGVERSVDVDINRERACFPDTLSRPLGKQRAGSASSSTAEHRTQNAERRPRQRPAAAPKEFR